MSDQQSLTITVTPREVDALKSMRATTLSPEHRRKLSEVRRFIEALDYRQWIERKSLLLAIDEVLA